MAFSARADLRNLLQYLDLEESRTIPNSPINSVKTALGLNRALLTE